MSKHCCPKDGCDFTTDSKVGLGVHKSRSHNLSKFVSSICEWCSKEFEKRRSEYERTDNDFCSRECHFSWKENTNYGNYEPKDCDFCGDKILVYPSEFEKYNNHFCSNECKIQFDKEVFEKEGHPRDGVGNYENCDSCGDEFYRRPGRVRENNYCSKKCMGEGFRIDDSISGGYGSNWREMRKKALKRDEYSCSVCDCSREEHYNNYDRDLDVHHKIPIAEFDKPEDANYLINLTTTCRGCHGKLDKISRREANRKPSISV